jgi:RNA polymerase sigma factor (sigma-70 family)
MEITSSLINEVVAGDKEKFRLIIEHCNLPLYRTAIAILKDDADAEDALQTAYVKAYLHLNSFRNESSFITWITRILINECKMMLRSKRKNMPLENEEAQQKTSPAESGMDSLYNKQINQLLENAVMSLPEKYRLVYVVREVNELSTEKTASALGITTENVKVRLHRAKSLMRENLLRQVNANELFPFHKARCARVANKVMDAITSFEATSVGLSQ